MIPLNSENHTVHCCASVGRKSPKIKISKLYVKLKKSHEINHHHRNNKECRNTVGVNVD